MKRMAQSPESHAEPNIFGQCATDVGPMALMSHKYRDCLEVQRDRLRDEFDEAFDHMEALRSEFLERHAASWCPVCHIHAYHGNCPFQRARIFLAKHREEPDDGPSG